MPDDATIEIGPMPEWGSQYSGWPSPTVGAGGVAEYLLPGGPTLWDPWFRAAGDPEQLGWGIVGALVGGSLFGIVGATVVGGWVASGGAGMVLAGFCVGEVIGWATGGPPPLWERLRTFCEDLPESFTRFLTVLATLLALWLIGAIIAGSVALKVLS